MIRYQFSFDNMTYKIQYFYWGNSIKSKYLN